MVSDKLDIKQKICEQLFPDYSALNWKSVVNMCMKLKELWAADEILDNVVDNFIIEMGIDDSFYSEE